MYGVMITIVIPTYNRASIIAKSLYSVFSQTYSDWECLVVDDFSTDNTKEIVKSFCAKDSRVQYLLNESKKGANGARNTGIVHAKGEYVSFLDSDDEWLPEMLEKQIKQYLKSDTIGAVYSNLHHKTADGNETEFGIPLGIHGNIYKETLTQGYMAPTSVISAKRNILKEIGLFDLTLPASQDDDICFKLAKKCEIAYIPEVMAYMHINSNNRISDNNQNVAMGWWMLWNKYETDVIEYCGKKVMAKHYKECLHHFVNANNAKMSWKAYRKYTQFGGNLSKKRQIILFFYWLSLGKNRRITHKTQKMI